MRQKTCMCFACANVTVKKVLHFTLQCAFLSYTRDNKYYAEVFLHACHIYYSTESVLLSCGVQVVQ